MEGTLGRVVFSSLFQAAQPRHHDPIAGLFAPEIVADEVDLPRQLHHVYNLWMLKRGDRAMPAQRDIDPIDLRWTLPFLVLWDVTRPGPGFICRVAGTEICHRAGRELRGSSLEAMAGDSVAPVLDEYRSVVRTGHIHLVERPMSWFGRPLRAYRRMVLPLSGATGQIDYVLTCVDFGEENYLATRLN